MPLPVPKTSSRKAPQQCRRHPFPQSSVLPPRTGCQSSSPQRRDLTFLVPGPEEPRPQHQAPLRLRGPQDEPGGGRAPDPRLLQVSDPGASAPGGWAARRVASVYHLLFCASVRSAGLRHLQESLVGLLWALGRGVLGASSGALPCLGPSAHCAPAPGTRVTGRNSRVSSRGRTLVANSRALCLPHRPQGAPSPCCHGRHHLLGAWAFPAC